MALNFPANPNANDTYTVNNTTWKYDGSVWNVVQSDSTRNLFAIISGDAGSTSAEIVTDTLNIVGGSNVTTNVTNKTVTINAAAGNLYSSVVSDDGTATASTSTDTLSILGGTNISTAIATDTNNLSINMDAFDIGFLSNVSNASPTSGQVLKWDGAQWAPGADISSGGGGDTTSVIAPVAFGRVADTADASGTNISWSNWQAGAGELDFTFSTAQPDTNYIVVTDAETFDDYYVGISSKTVNGFTASFYDSIGVRAPSSASPFTIMVYGSTPTVDISVGANADTLDGFEGTYYLDYNNFTNTPSVLTLTSLSVGNELAASGDGAISYDDTTGVFRYTPPDLSSYLTSVAFGDLTGTPTTLSGYGITDAQSTLVSGTNIKTINGSSLLGSGDITISGGAGGGIELTDLSVGAEGTASGDGSISYDNTTGTFTYTPPVIPSILTDLGISDGSTGQVLTTNGSGSFTFTTVSSGTSNFSSLSEPSAASLTVDKIYEPAVIMFRVNNVSATAYTFDSHYSGNNPNIYVISGTTVAFDLDNISGHPFEIQDNTLSALTSNLVHVSNTGTVSLNSAAQGKSSGTLYWRIPENISGTYVYQCQSHAAMFGNITIKRLSLL